MRKTIFMSLLLGMSSTLFADELSVETFTIAAGEEKMVRINLDNESAWSAVQFVLELPEGLSIKKKSNGDPNFVLTDRLKPTVYDEDEGADIIARHTVNTNLMDGLYHVAVWSPQSLDIVGNSGAILTITVIASDQVSSGEQKCKLTGVKLIDHTGEIAYTQPDTECDCNININTTVTTLGYASFSWPRALDFSNSGLVAYIATDCNGKSIQLQEVTKVPANTGLILKGAEGTENTYQLQTTDDEGLDDVSSNQLTGTANEAYNVESNNIYVLSNLDDGKPGFYLASNGIQVAQYKAYLTYSGDAPAREGLTFNESETPTGIGGNKLFIMNGRQDESIYDLQGRSVKPHHKGIYVSGGKKIIVK